MSVRERVREVRTALGDADRRREKRALVRHMMRAFRDKPGRRRRLEAFRDAGLLDELPNDWQIAVGAYRMWRDWVVPVNRRFYRAQRRNILWQQVLRLLDDPGAVLDPTGFSVSREMIASHLLQVSHQDASYDVELLRMFPKGVESLRDEIEAAIAGTHPRTPALRQVTGVAEYHPKLLAEVEAYLADPVGHWKLLTRAPLPGTEKLLAINEERFATPSRFLRYCLGMPKTPGESVRSLLPPLPSGERTEVGG